MGQRSITAMACALCVGAFTGTAAADETGFELGARLGYGIPLGSLGEEDGEGLDLKDFAGGVVPFWIDLGARVMPELMVGGFLQLGVGFVGDTYEQVCDTDGVDCSITMVRIGAQLQYHPLPFQDVDPWVGGGIGYEWLTLGVETPVSDGSITVRGFEFLNLQGGVDFKVGQSGGIGPFLSFSLGQYDTVSSEDDEGSESDDIPEKALHQWLVLGVRGTFVL